jgi:hypothetical protein
MISTASKPFRSYLLITVAVAAIVTPSCYTLLQHPRVAQIDYERPDGKQCFDCHTDEEIKDFHHQPKAPEMGNPWWYERYWYYDASPDLETVPLHDRSMDGPLEVDAPPLDQITAPTGKPKAPNTAAQEKKEKGDGKIKDKPEKSKRPVRPKGEKKKKKKKP